MELERMASAPAPRLPPEQWPSIAQVSFLD